SLGVDRRRLAMPLAQVQALDHHAVLLAVDTQDRPFLTPLVTADHEHAVSLPDRHFSHQITSGASDTIFMYLFSRSSRPTGPKMRVARGSPASLMMTAAFSSKRMYEPSLRRTSLRVRTTTAFATSPFFTVPSGRASLTATITVSPMRAYRRLLPPSTRMTSAFLAPLLAAIRTIDSCWIICLRRQRSASAIPRATGPFPE